MEEALEDLAEELPDAALDAVVVRGEEEVGVGEAGVGGDAEDGGAGGAKAAVELEREHEVGEFGLLVGAIGVSSGG